MKTHFVFSNFSENRAVYKVLQKNAVEPGRPQMAIWHMRIACWMTTATNTHSEYVIFPTASMDARTRLNVTLYVHCLSC